MATALLRSALYEEDYLAWIEQQVALLRAGRTVPGSTLSFFESRRWTKIQDKRPSFMFGPWTRLPGSSTARRSLRIRSGNPGTSDRRA